MLIVISIVWMQRQVLYKYHHNARLYKKISLGCCCLCCYQCQTNWWLAFFLPKYLCTPWYFVCPESTILSVFLPSQAGTMKYSALQAAYMLTSELKPAARYIHTWHEVNWGNCWMMRDMLDGYERKWLMSQDLMSRLCSATELWLPDNYQP